MRTGWSLSRRWTEISSSVWGNPSPASTGLSVCLSEETHHHWVQVCLSVCLRKPITSEDRSVCLSVYMNVCLSVCLSERPSVCLFICIFVCMRNVGLGERTIITRLWFVSWLTGECAFCTGGIDNSWPFFSDKKPHENEDEKQENRSLFKCH